MFVSMDLIPAKSIAAGSELNVHSAVFSFIFAAHLKEPHALHYTYTRAKRANDLCHLQPAGARCRFQRSFSGPAGITRCNTDAPYSRAGRQGCWQQGHLKGSCIGKIPQSHYTRAARTVRGTHQLPGRRCPGKSRCTDRERRAKLHENEKRFQS